MIEAPAGCFLDSAACICWNDDTPCACAREERALRNIIIGNYRPMTDTERAWCRDEIASIEGYTAKDAEGADADVARTVISAWVDYCRDKGLM